MMREILLAGCRVADDTPCYVVAELGSNHGGDVTEARYLIRLAAQAGAHAVKGQVRTQAALYTDARLAAPYAHEHSYGATYGAHRAALELSEAGLVACQHEARARGVTWFATAFDEAAVDRLMALEVRCSRSILAG